MRAAMLLSDAYTIVSERTGKADQSDACTTDLKRVSQNRTLKDVQAER
jgi:hypothetical protein